jgi:hypothetical protein
MTFSRDKYTTEVMEQKISVPYKVKGNNVVVEMYGVEQKIPFEINGDTLVFNYMEWKRVK